MHIGHCVLSGPSALPREALHGTAAAQEQYCLKFFAVVALKHWLFPHPHVNTCWLSPSGTIEEGLAAASWPGICLLVL